MFTAFLRSSRLVPVGSLVCVVAFLLAAMELAYSQDASKKRTGLTSSGLMDQTNSFRNMAFGSSIEEVQKTIKLEPIAEDQAKGDPLKTYIRSDEKKSLGDVAIQEVVYYFLEEKFYAVLISTLDYRQTENLRKALDIVYGASPHIDKESRNLVWSGKNTTAFMRSDRVTGEARTMISCNELQKSYDRLSRESATKASGEL